MIWAIGAILCGLILLIWSADRFVEGSAWVARYFGLPPLLVGMLVIGFGTSAPELSVSILAAIEGNTGIVLGNAYGSNITNIGLILGLTALLRPIRVLPGILRKELPILCFVTILTAVLLNNGILSRMESGVLIIVFLALTSWSIRDGLRQKTQSEIESESQPLRQMTPGKAVFRTVMGLILLVAASRILVWGAVELAQQFGVSDLIIGLTIVAIGTSLPELASSLSAIRKGEDDLALGNILGSNLFNTLIVVGVAGLIQPMRFGPEIGLRDIPVMALFTFALFAFAYSRRGEGHIFRWKGGVLLLGYLLYLGYLIQTTV